MWRAIYCIGNMLSFLEVTMGYLWPISQLDSAHFQYFKFGLVARNIQLGLCPHYPCITWRFYLDFLKHVYILGSFYCVRYPYYLLMTLNFNRIFPYLLPHLSFLSSSPFVPVPVTTTSIHLSLSIVLFFLRESSLSLSSPLLYPYPL